MRLRYCVQRILMRQAQNLALLFRSGQRVFGRCAPRTTLPGQPYCRRSHEKPLAVPGALFSGQSGSRESLRSAVSGAKAILSSAYQAFLTIGIYVFWQVPSSV